MKTVRWLSLSLMPFFVVSINIAAVAGQVVLPKKDSVAVYQNETRRHLETPLFIASLEDRLLVIKSGKDRYLVKNTEGLRGWIEKNECVVVQAGKRIDFDSLIIQIRWDDLQSFIWVGGDPAQDDGRIYIGRSFKGELVSNIDRDEVERKRHF
jgi:hypothetical protein